MGYLYYDGTLGNHTEATDAAFNITGDLEVIVDVALDDYTHTDIYSLIAMDDVTLRKFGFSHLATWASIKTLYWDSGGTLRQPNWLEPSPPYVNGARYEFRFAVDVDNDAGGHDLWVQYREHGSDTWLDTSTATPVTTAGTITLRNHNPKLTVGGRDNASSEPMIGKLFAAKMYDGGTLVYDADYTALTTAEVAAGSFTESSATGATVTLTGSAWTYVRQQHAVAGPGQLLRTGG